MTTPSPTGSGAEPERGTVGLLARLFLTQLLAVLGVAALITVAFSLLGLGDRAAVETRSRPGAGPTPAGPGIAAPGTTPPGTTPPGTTPPGTTPPPAPAATPSGSLPQSTTGTTGARLGKVDVLNQSAGQGAAEAAADRLRDRGWRIGRVDDFVGNVRTTTIYYPPGLRPRARALAGDFERAPRILPAFDTLSARRLSVVLVG